MCPSAQQTVIWYGYSPRGRAWGLPQTAEGSLGQPISGDYSYTMLPPQLLLVYGGDNWCKCVFLHHLLKYLLLCFAALPSLKGKRPRGGDPQSLTSESRVGRPGTGEVWGSTGVREAPGRCGEAPGVRGYLTPRQPLAFRGENPHPRRGSEDASERNRERDLQLPSQPNIQSSWLKLTD